MLMAVLRCEPDADIGLRDWRRRLAAGAAIMLQCVNDRRSDLTIAGFVDIPQQSCHARSLIDCPHRRHRSVPAASFGEPAWSDYRCNRDRQDRDPAGHGRKILVDRRAGLHGRRQGRSGWHLAKRGADRAAHQAYRRPWPAGAKLRGQPGDTVGCLWRGRASAEGDRLRHGTHAAVTHAQPQRDPGRGAQSGLQDCR